MYQPPNSDGWFLWVQDPIAENFIIADGILVLAAGVAGVALNGVDDAVFAFFHDADVIGFAVLRAGCAVRSFQSKKTIIPGAGSIVLSAHCPWLRNHYQTDSHAGFDGPTEGPRHLSTDSC